MKVAEHFVVADKVCDFIPVISTISNIVDMIAKVALAIFAKCAPKSYEALKNKNAWIQHLDQKSFIECALLTIPVINTTIATGLMFGRALTSLNT